LLALREGLLLVAELGLELGLRGLAGGTFLEHAFHVDEANALGRGVEDNGAEQAGAEQAGEDGFTVSIHDQSVWIVRRWRLAVWRYCRRAGAGEQSGRMANQTASPPDPRIIPIQPRERQR
jgi:hypothetical protein